VTVATSTATSADPAVDLHHRALVIDGMNNAGLSREYFERILQGGVTAAMVPVSITDPFSTAVDKVLSFRALVGANEDLALVVESAADIHAAKTSGRVGLIVVFEDTRQLEKDLRKVDLFRRLGVRRFQLVYTTLNDVGCGAGDRVDSGLSRFGVELIGELERCGMLIDLSHAGPQTLADALEVVTKPCVWSHCNVQGVFGHKNNLTDEQLDGVAANGGVIGISGVPFYTGEAGATIEKMIDHVDYVRERIGVDHAGIGLAIFENHPLSFYDQFAALPKEIYGTPPWDWPEGIATVSEFPNITAALGRRGYTDDEILKVLGGNLLRVCEAAWR
jgi:membrane dipeptidase